MFGVRCPKATEKIVGLALNGSRVDRKASKLIEKWWGRKESNPPFNVSDRAESGEWFRSDLISPSCHDTLVYSQLLRKTSMGLTPDARRAGM
jgi:hypothetical protein